MTAGYFVAASAFIMVAIGPEILKRLTTVRPYHIRFAPLRSLDPEAQTLEGVERLFEDDPSFKVIIECGTLVNDRSCVFQLSRFSSC